MCTGDGGADFAALFSFVLFNGSYAK